MSKSSMFGIVTLAVVVVVLYMSMFVVKQTEVAIKFHFGKVVRSGYEPGLHFQIPIYHNVLTFDKRILTLDSNPQRILTGEQKNVMVDYFVKWRISEVVEYYNAFNAEGLKNPGRMELVAADRMAQTVKDGLQSELGDRTIREVVSGERTEIMKNVSDRVNEKMGEFGIEVIDVRIKQIELPRSVSESVFERMRAGRALIAKEHRAKGERESLIIRASANRQRTEMLAEAERKAAEIRGAGAAQAVAIYAAAYKPAGEFYEYLRTLEAYEKAFQDQNFMVFEPDKFRFFQYLEKGMPEP